MIPDNPSPLILHLIYFGYEPTVVDSQVITPARRMAADGLPVELLFFEKPGLLFQSSTRSSLQERRARAGLPAAVLPRIPRNLFGLNRQMLRSWLRRHEAMTRPVVLHARGCQSASLALSVRRAFPLLRVIADVRGDEAEEYRYAASNAFQHPLGWTQRWWLARLHEIQRRVVAEADAVFSVSRAMAQAIPGLTKRGDAGRWLCVPCVTETERFAPALAARETLRRELGVTDRRVLVFMGGREPWQALDTSAHAFAACRARDPRAFLLALTTEVEAMTRTLRSAGVAENDARVMRVRSDEVPAYLAAGDVGLLLRDAAALNRVAFPTKFAEFLAAGLSVVATDVMSDIAAFINEEGVGTVIPCNLDAPALGARLHDALAAAFPAPERIARATDAARRRLDWSVYLPQIKKWYLELAREASSAAHSSQTR